MSDNNSGNAETAIPDLYRLLKLQPLEEDRAKLESALRHCMVRARELQASDPKGAQRLARVVELSQRYLLNASNKQAYDRKWRAQYQPEASLTPAGVAPRASRVATVEPDVFAQYLPSGDPTAPFDLASFLESSLDSPPSSGEGEFQQLLNLLSSSLEPPATDSNPMVGQHPAASAPHQPHAASPFAASPANEKNQRLLPADVKLKSNAKGGRSLAADLRSKRDQKLLTMIAGVLVSLAAMLGLLFFLLRERPPTTVAQDAPPAVPPIGPTVSDEERRAIEIHGSGLPSVAGFDEAMDNGDTSGNEPESDSNGENNGLNVTVSMQEAQLDIGLTQSERPVDEPLVPMQSTSDATNMSSEATPVPTTPPTAEPAPESVVELTDEEQRAWDDQLLEIRKQLSQKEFADARQGLSQATQQIKRPQQRQQLQRLNTLSTLAEEFQNALVAAVRGLRGGDTITVGSTVASVVEGNAERLVIKVAGQNKTYNLIDIPAGLAFTLSEFKLEIGSPQTAARQAAFAGLHPRVSDVALTKARELMQQAIDANAVADDMLLVFEEDYLPASE